jgi:uncharacterized membrane protein
MNLIRRTRAGRELAALIDNLWFVPATCVVAAIVLCFGLLHWDESDPLKLDRALNPSSATSALAALGSGMLAFTGFVTAVVMMVVQFGTSEFSPRYLNWFRRDRTLRYALGAFTATFVFALVATAQVGRGSGTFVPTRTLIAALVLMIVSIAMFLALIDLSSYGLRVASVVQELDAEARRVFDTVYPVAGSEVEATDRAVEALQGRSPVQAIGQGPVGAVVVALDRSRFARLADRHDVVLVLACAVGDHVAANRPLLEVYGAHPVPEGPFRKAILLGDERTLDDDPGFAIRLLVDVAIKALSPAVNDPTTAVQSLDRVEDLLRYAAGKRLSNGVVCGRDGTVRLVYPTPGWDDLVELALDEIRAFGAGQYQIARRMRALLQALIEDVDERRRDALVRQLSLLDDAVAAAVPSSQRADALVADRQGIGMARRSGRRWDQGSAGDAEAEVAG